MVNQIFDPTPEQKWVRLKAGKLKIHLKEKEVPAVPNVPSILQKEMNNLSNAIGWCKPLAGIRNFGVSNIQDYFQKINILFSKSFVVKKHFQRGTQLMEENYIDIGSIYSKQNDDFFCIKGTCAVSLKNKNRWAVAVIDKKNSGVIFAHCE